jgi:hypothetical protein
LIYEIEKNSYQYVAAVFLYRNIQLMQKELPGAGALCIVAYKRINKDS